MPDTRRNKRAARFGDAYYGEPITATFTVDLSRIVAAVEAFKSAMAAVVAVGDKTAPAFAALSAPAKEVALHAHEGN